MYTFTTGAICIFDRSEQLLEKLRQSYEAEVDTLKRSQLELVDRNKVGVKTFQSGGKHFGPEVARKLKTKTKILVIMCVYYIMCRNEIQRPMNDSCELAECSYLLTPKLHGFHNLFGSGMEFYRVEALVAGPGT